MKILDISQNKYYTINELLKIMEILRGENGCPWDKQQTHKSIRNDFIEETYEAVEAIDTENPVLLREELGDVLLQVVFHCRIEEESGNFNFNDIVNELCHKLIIRHPHVFSDVNVNSTSEVLNNWEQIKNKTKGTKSYTQTLTNVPSVLPALMRANKIGQRAKKAGMDFSDTKSTYDRLVSEVKELEDAINKNSNDEIFDEVGDVLFSCVNLARRLDVNPEEALTRSCEKFIKRFEKVEQLTRLKGIDMKSLSIEELDVYWDKAKREI